MQRARIQAGKVGALMDGRYHVAFEDVDAAALPGLRHRVIMNFEGEAEGISADEVVKAALKAVPHAES